MRQTKEFNDVNEKDTLFYANLEGYRHSTKTKTD